MHDDAPAFRREQYRTFKYLAGFVREWDRLGLEDDDLNELEQLILTDPDAGALVSGTGGLRKLRFASRHHAGVVANVARCAWGTRTTRGWRKSRYSRSTRRRISLTSRPQNGATSSCCSTGSG